MVNDIVIITILKFDSFQIFHVTNWDIWLYDIIILQLIRAPFVNVKD